MADQDKCVTGNGEQHGASITPQELRVVCDNMLQGLGRYLRCVGVDVLMLENTDDHKVAAQVRYAQNYALLKYWYHLACIFPPFYSEETHEMA